ncbi:cation/acetate symporter ActP [Vibrio viridaestus]|uniref:Cation/acetate symporter ActP n=2 Tax=Vibrio viridaestus TaxID=2487322 RepID=A0A3N9U0F6_9VIBR|nr:cation/acetate symporter ActP [Vibrio viridaestus]
MSVHAKPLDNIAQTSSNPVSIIFFLIIILMTLCITWWAARRTKTAQDFYSAGGNISGFQNGLAIAGDAMSAGALLGLTGLVFSKGFDGLVYAIGYTTGLPIVVFLMAAKMRELGKFTFIDVVCSKLSGNSIRIFSAFASLIIVLFYLVAQMVGAGQLIEIMFGIDYVYAVVLVGVLMVFYVAFGGMMATTWVQMIKAVLMICSCFFICILVLNITGFDFTLLLDLAVKSHSSGSNILIPNNMSNSPWSAFSLGIALMLGTAGLPHVLMRFFTVPDANAARSSVLWANLFMNSFYAMIFIIGFGALYILRNESGLLDINGNLLSGNNTAALQLAYFLGGNPLFGFLSAVAFATILAVVAGLTLSGASAVSHDIYGSFKVTSENKETIEMRIMKVSVITLGIIAIILSILFRGQNIAYMISLAFSISCSSTFPVLLLSMYWSRLTSVGATIGGTSGLIASLVMTILGKSIWVDILGHQEALVSLDPPAIVTVPLAFTMCILVSLYQRRAVSFSANPHQGNS